MCFLCHAQQLIVAMFLSVKNWNEFLAKNCWKIRDMTLIYRSNYSLMQTTIFKRGWII